MAIPNNYRLFKFKNGEDVIAECFETPEDQNHYVLRRPMQIQIMMGLDKDRNPVPKKLIMTEWLAFADDDTAVVPRSEILCWGKPTKLIVAVYDTEKKRIDAMRANIDTETPPPNELDKTDEQIAADKAKKHKANKKDRRIFINMSLGDLMKFLEGVGLDIDDEPWKSLVNPPDEDEDEDDEEESPPNIDGSLDIMPDEDGKGWHDPYGNRWEGPPPD